MLRLSHPCQVLALALEAYHIPTDAPSRWHAVHALADAPMSRRSAPMMDEG